MFKFIQLLEYSDRLNRETIIDTLKKGMEVNYLLDYIPENEEEEAVVDELTDKFNTMVSWNNYNANLLNNLPKGTIFKGCDENSIMRLYVIMENDGEDPKWYPISNEADVIYILSIFINNKWKNIAIGTQEDLEEFLLEKGLPHHLYKFTDINGDATPVELFEGSEDPNGVYFSMLTPVEHEGHIHDGITFIPVTTYIQNLKNSKQFLNEYKNLKELNQEQNNINNSNNANNNIHDNNDDVKYDVKTDFIKY